MRGFDREKYKAGYDAIDWSKPLPEVRTVKCRGPMSSFPAPMVIGDSMEPTQHVDGKLYTSKSQYRAVTKAHGMIEVGNDPARFRPNKPPKPDRKAIKEAVQRAFAIHNP